jgi:hypothetical protein
MLQKSWWSFVHFLEFFVRKVVVAAAVTVNHAAAAAQTVFHHSVVSLYLVSHY